MTGPHDRITIDEAATILRTSVATPRYWRFNGTGRYRFRFGPRVMYRSRDLRDWIDRQADNDIDTDIA